ncbi:hypothetical protein L5515_009431 [Caenorhabditis briggsae]|uniref:F-box domain-containing protein n=1 Tax=Caenorhabditis briggsae TaxID=6238 RepID=A0AAE9D249_CAEBR|nr:hypothetical protein L3Y34_009598 [Caenorhabditis briggsae]UMM37766.1 hypothetical protein L5515_009431 [Caenorhabditis briggsae]
MADYVQPTLLDMPEIVMNHIFSYLDVKSIFKMQKVCLQLHNFVDEQKPDIHLTSMELKATTYGFTCRISSELFGNFRIKYLKTAMACPRMRKNGILLEHDYPMPVFFEDIARLLDFQKSPLQELELVLKYKKYDLEYGHMLEFLKNRLKNRPKKLRTRWLWMSALDQSHVMQILPNIDFCGIGRITVSDAVVDYDRDKDQKMEINEILEMKEFNEFEKLNISKFSVDSEDYEENVVEKFLEIPEVYLKLKKITIEDLEMIRNNYLDPKSLKNSQSIFELKFKEFEDFSQFRTSLVDPFSHYYGERWFFKNSGSGSILCMQYEDNCFTFSLEVEEDLPEGVIIQET